MVETSLPRIGFRPPPIPPFLCYNRRMKRLLVLPVLFLEEINQDMNKPIHTFRHAVMTVLTFGVVTVCASVSHPAYSQSQNNIPVIVMGEDEDPTSVGRESDIFKRVLAQLKDSMFRKGFRIRDEEMIVVDLGWKIVNRRPKTELIEAAKLANNSVKGNHRSRALVLFRIHTTKKGLSYSTKIETRIAGELYDLVSNEFLGNFELPMARYSAPLDCDKFCITNVVGKRAREIAAGIGDALGKKLVNLSPPTGRSRGGTSSAQEGGVVRCGGLQTTYTVTLRGFDSSETLRVINTMEREFPCYSSHNLLPGKSSAVRRYEYVSREKSGKIDEWLSIALMEMGLNPDNDVEIYFDGNEFILDKIIYRPKSAPNPKKSRYK